MTRNHTLVALALVGALVGASCNTKSPTAPKPSPTPTANSIALTVSSSQAQTGSAILFSARVTSGSGGQTVPDGTSVLFKIFGCTGTGQVGNKDANPYFLESGACQETRTTVAGVAAANLFSAQPGGIQVTAASGGAQAAGTVRFFSPVNASNLAIYGVVPNQGSYTGGQTVTIQGRGFVAPVTVDFNVGGTIRHAAVTSVAADGSSVTVTTPSIQFIANTGSVLADIVVVSCVACQTANGQSLSASDTLTAGFVFLFPVVPPVGTPQIFTIVPSAGSVAGGTTVTVYGANFAPPVTVLFGAENVQVLSVSSDQTTLTLLTPKHSGKAYPDPAGTVDVAVTNSAGNSVTRGGGWVWLPVGVTPPSGTPQIFAIVPSSGSVKGGDTVTIYGANFAKPVTVAFGAENVQVVNVSADGAVITVLTPKHSGPAGTVDVIETNWDGTTVTRAGGWTWTNGTTGQGAPQIFAIVPASGLVTGGAPVTIYGANFLAPVTVRLGTEAAQVVSVASDGSTVSILTPQHSGAVGAVDVILTNSDGTTVTRTGGFTWVAVVTAPPAPVIIAPIQPDRGAARGGDSVLINGTGLCATIDSASGKCIAPPAVTFNTIPAQVTSFASDGTRLTVTTPPITTSPNPVTANITVNVTVTNSSGNNTLINGFTYLAENIPPQIYSIVPNQGLVTGGDPVTIYGANFVKPVTVALGAENAQVVNVAADGSTISILTPKHSGAIPAAPVDVTVTVASGLSFTRAGGWTWLPVSSNPGAPVIYQLSPNTGSPRGGETVLILGANLCGTVNTVSGKCDSLPTVSFALTTGDTRAAQVVSVSPDGKTLTVLTPQVSPNPVVTDVNANVIVTNGIGLSNSSSATNIFTFKAEAAPPLLYYVQPNSGSDAGGDMVTIFGRFLLPPLKVVFAKGGTAIVDSVAADDTSAVVTTPLNPPITGLFGGSNTLPDDITVTTQYGTGRDQSVTLASGFNWLASSLTPAIYSLSPNSGPLEGGTRVTIEGTGFQYPVQVFFGTVLAQVVTSNLNEVVCLSPSITPSQPATPTTVQVTVVNTKNGKTSNALPFHYGSAMFISSNAPALGPDTGGTVVTIFGQGFVAPVSVTFAGFPAANILTVSGTEVVAKTGAVPSGQRQCNPISGPVVVTNIDSSTNASGGGWTYTPANPLITGISVTGTGASGNTVPRFGSSCNSGTYTMTISGVNFEDGHMRVKFGTINIEVPATFVNSTTLTVTIPNLSAVPLTKLTCTTGTGQSGQELAATPIDITVTNEDNKCSDTLTGGLIIAPCAADGDTTCTVPPTPPPAPAVTITPATQTVSAAGPLPAQVSFIVTVTPAQAVGVALTYGGGFTFCGNAACTPLPAAPTSVTTNSSGVGSLTLWVPTGVVAGQSGTIIGSFSTAVSAPAVVNVGP